MIENETHTKATTDQMLADRLSQKVMSVCIHSVSLSHEYDVRNLDTVLSAQRSINDNGNTPNTGADTMTR